ncbi:Hypothetical protein SRAE_X000178300 [Strongyloides ratti]|uniref:Uncharacterized protein n=1 Tax=Strongyloides ratti TaxID=34506 RepID=A0A090KXR8_STRRB|nr:Hypothetical protein SRAE_X000178300 [Strongyloides ratti]CEF60043.1 Hypothetical protein SRAE_X000178300 [Strongyloides ratti]
MDFSNFLNFFSNLQNTIGWYQLLFFTTYFLVISMFCLVTCSIFICIGHFNNICCPNVDEPLIGDNVEILQSINETPDMLWSRSNNKAVRIRIDQHKC